jgi:phosphoribosylanthranilate isomerase
MALWIKICGITSVDDAHLVVDAGADAIGVNLVPSSKRCVDADTARAIARAVGARVELVAVVADMHARELASVRARLGVSSVQLHGSELPEALEPLLPAAYKALRIATAADVALASGYGGSRLLVDAKVDGALGGTGHVFDWSLVARLARERPLVLAGGLTPDNVAAAVGAVRPFGVDTASGVEGSDPRRKDPARVARFVEAARRAASDAGLDAAPAVDYLAGRSP